MKWYKPYTGYVREILTYLFYSIAPKSRPQKKFVIFTIGRSGSTLLVSLLHSHASIFCDDELFRRKLFSPLCYLKAKERINRKNAYGFKLNTYHFRVQKIQDPAVLLKSIVEMGYVIISLERRNLLRQVISHMHAVQTDQFHLRGAERKKETRQIHIDIQRLEQELQLFESYQTLQNKLLEPYSYLRIVYEDDLLESSQHQSTVDRVCNFLGIPAAKVASNLEKTTPTDLSHLIVNYSQVEEYLKATRYAGQLDKD